MRRSTNVGRQLHLSSAPCTVRATDVEIKDTVAPRVGGGQILVRNAWLALDPRPTTCCREEVSHGHPAARAIETLGGAALGQVIESRAEDVPAGTWVVHHSVSGELAVVAAEAAFEVDVESAARPERLIASGADGLAAYVALADTAQVAQGDVVLVSGAASWVGGLAGQLATKLGAATVIGIESGLDATLAAIGLGFDAVLDAAAGPVPIQLADAAPEGVDVYIQVEGADQLEAALDALRPAGRAVMLGTGGATGRRALGPSNLGQIVAKSLSLHGVPIGGSVRPGDVARATRWLGELPLPGEVTEVDGLEQVPIALSMLAKKSVAGPTLVRLKPAAAAVYGFGPEREVTEEYFKRLVGGWSDDLESGA